MEAMIVLLSAGHVVAALYLVRLGHEVDDLEQRVVELEEPMRRRLRARAPFQHERHRR